MVYILSEWIDLQQILIEQSDTFNIISLILIELVYLIDTSSDRVLLLNKRYKQLELSDCLKEVIVIECHQSVQLLSNYILIVLFHTGGSQLHMYFLLLAIFFHLLYELFFSSRVVVFHQAQQSQVTCIHQLVQT